MPRQTVRRRAARVAPNFRQGVIEFEKTRVPSLRLFSIRIYNDFVTPQPYLSQILQEKLHLGRIMADEVAAAVQKQGTATCAIEPFEPAEFHVEQLLGFGLVANIEQHEE